MFKSFISSSRVSPTQPLQSVSILSKTQHYIQERRKRSQSQPPVDKSEKRKFDFLSTANFDPAASKQREGKVVEKSYPETFASKPPLKSSPEKSSNRENHRSKPSKSCQSIGGRKQKDDKQNLQTPQFYCNMQKFEFALHSHRTFVQTLVWENWGWNLLHICHPLLMFYNCRRLEILRNHLSKINSWAEIYFLSCNNWAVSCAMILFWAPLTPHLNLMQFMHCEKQLLMTGIFSKSSRYAKLFIGLGSKKYINHANG